MLCNKQSLPSQRLGKQGFNLIKCRGINSVPHAYSFFYLGSRESPFTGLTYSCGREREREKEALVETHDVSYCFSVDMAQ